MNKLYNNPLGRALHDILYCRIVDFCHNYTPELPADVVATEWLNKFYSNDESIHILVNLDDKFNMTAHCLIIVAKSYSCTVIFCHQLQDDKKSGTFLPECMEYIDKLAIQVNAACTSISVTKGVKVMERKYQYKTVRTNMVKSYVDADDTDAVTNAITNTVDV